MLARLSQLPFASAPINPVFDQAEVVRAAVGGSRTAFDQLYTRYAGLVHGILLARVPFSEAEDLVQDVFFTAFRKLSGLREPAAFPGWLAAIARNQAMEYHRAARRQWDAPFQTAGEAASKPESDALHVLDIIRTLPEAYRETLVLRLVEGMTGPEIAQRTGLTPDSVRVNLFRGIKLLREQLGGGTAK